MTGGGSIDGLMRYRVVVTSEVGGISYRFVVGETRRYNGAVHIQDQTVAHEREHMKRRASSNHVVTGPDDEGAIVVCELDRSGRVLRSSVVSIEEVS